MRGTLISRVTGQATLLLLVTTVLGTTPVHAIDGGTLRVTPHNGWLAFEVITQGDNPGGDGSNYALPGTFDGAGAWLLDASTLRIQVNHETSDASISEVDISLLALQDAIENMRSMGTVGSGTFVLAARQAYGRFSDDGGASFTVTTSNATTSFSRFCSGQAYAPNTFGPARGFVDQLYITGEETSGGALVVLDSVNRDLFALSGVVGSAPGGIGGMPADPWENAALIDTGETGHVALLLSPDGGSQQMKLYVGVKGRGVDGSPANSFLARNGLAYGSWYYLNSSLPSLGNTNNGSFDTSSSGALASDKLEDVDTSPSDPTRVVLGDQTSGVFTFDFSLVFDGGGFDPGASSFTLTKISNEGGSTNSVDSTDNVDWTAATTLNGVSYPDGLIFVNEDNSSGEIWMMEPDGTNQVRIGSTTVSAESSGIFDLSEFVGYAPGSVLVTNNQGSPASMTVLINPDAQLENACGNGACGGGENASTCPEDCPGSCGDTFCTGGETTGTCPTDCGSACGDAVCNGSEATINCPADCGTLCGDGVIGGDEACEAGAALTETCVGLGFTSGSLACDVTTCEYDESACVGGNALPDAGPVTMRDAGPGATLDAGMPADAGASVPPTDGGGCGCRVGAGQSASGRSIAFALCVLGLGIARIKRRETLG